MNEFDALSEKYSAGFDDPLKRIVGASAADFLRPKVRLLITVARKQFSESMFPQLRFLDFGCGTADFLVQLIGCNTGWQLEGCDVSQGMLSEARRKHGTKLQSAKIWSCDALELPKDSYNIVTAVCVFHHIDPAEWVECARRVYKSLVKGGVFLLFEHNPLNPLTRWMVSRTEVDRNAHLLNPAVSKNLVKNAGFANVTMNHFLFFPPRLKLPMPMERVFQFIPLGGQYLVVAVRN